MNVIDLLDSLHLADRTDTILHLAIICQYTSTAIQLIDSFPSSINIGNELCQTPLHIAALTNQRDIVIKLVQSGADCNLVDLNGNTALHIATVKGFRSVVSELVERTDVAIRNCDGLSCVHLAAKRMYLRILDMLLCRGKADINQRDTKSGRTILHYAVENGIIVLLKHILRNPNIDVQCKTYAGHTPLMLANGRKDFSVATLLGYKLSFHALPKEVHEDRSSNDEWDSSSDEWD